MNENTPLGVKGSRVQIPPSRRVFRTLVRRVQQQSTAVARESPERRCSSGAGFEITTWGSVKLDPRRAAEELRKLRAQADTPKVRREGPEHGSWKAKVDAVMEGALGKDSETLRSFRAHRYSVGIWFGGPGEAQRDAQYFAERVGDAAGLVDAAIFQLELQAEAAGEDGVATRAVSTGPIFVVHGRDDARKYELMRLLEKAVAASQPIVLHEQACLL